MADERSSKHAHRLSWLIEPLLFLLLALASTWPLVTQIRTAIPQGRERVATVPLFNLWTIWWNADRVGDGLAHYWDAPIFAPAENTFALSESQPTTAVMAPVIWTSESRSLAYNLFLLGVLVANGCCGSLVVKRWAGNRLAGLWGGAAILLLPFVHWQLGVLQLTSIFGILLTLHFLIRFLPDYKLKDALATGASISLCYLSCNYFGYQLLLTLLFASPVLLVKRSSVWKLGTGAVVVVAVSSAIMLPVVLKQMEVSRQQEWSRNSTTVNRLSAIRNDYFRTLWRGPLSDGPMGKARFPLSPGAACATLALIGAVVGLRRRDTRRVTVFLLVFLAVAAQLSLGPPWVVGGHRPFEILSKWLPGLSAMRSPHRFAVLVQVSCVLLAGLSFLHWRSSQSVNEEIADGDDPLPKSNPILPTTLWQRFVWWGHVALLCGVLIESWPERPKLYSMPDYEQQRSWIEWLNTETDPDDIVANLPFPSGRSVGDYEDTAVAMLWGTYHKRPLANGYSGFFPKEFVQLKANVQSFPDDDSVVELRKAGVRWCVVDLGKLQRESVDKLPGQRLLSLQFATDDGKIRIYEVKPPAEFDWKFD